MANVYKLHHKEQDTGLKGSVAEADCVLRAAGIRTYKNYISSEATLIFLGGRSEGFRAFDIAIRAGLPVSGIRKTWTVNDEELTGPVWEIFFHR